MFIIHADQKSQFIIWYTKIISVNKHVHAAAEELQIKWEGNKTYSTRWVIRWHCCI